MVKKSLLKHDIFYENAKLKGYRSRAAFKLMQINRKFKIMKEGDTVVDLGAAPGGWSQVAKEIVRQIGTVISVDIQRIDKIDVVVFIECDIIKEKETVNAIREVLRNRGYADVVISDVSPKLSGYKSYDHFRSFELSKASLNIASLLLRSAGNFVAKMFQGELFEKFYNDVKERFGYTKVYSPEATRKSSAEIYVIGKGFKGSFRD